MKKYLIILIVFLNEVIAINLNNMAKIYNIKCDKYMDGIIIINNNNQQIPEMICVGKLGLWEKYNKDLTLNKKQQNDFENINVLKKESFND